MTATLCLLVGVFIGFGLGAIYGWSTGIRDRSDG